jgi:hypothetical protein
VRSKPRIRSTIIGRVATLALLAGSGTAVAQSSVPDAPATNLPDISVQPYATVRFFAGPSVNLMRDWRQGIDALAGLARARGLTPERECCISKSWGTTALVHVADRFAVGGSYEALRDTRKFRVTDTIDAFGFHGRGEFGFDNVTEVTATQAVVAVYPRVESHTHLQFGGGVGTGDTKLETPGSRSSASVRGPILSVSAGTETRFWYVDAGWRYARMRVGPRTASDFFLDEARDVFPDVASVDAFTRDRNTDLTGAWAHIGAALHLGRR